VTNRLTFLASAIVILGLPAAAGGQAGPAFDCSKASGRVETLVCEDDDLAALDRRMAGVYATAMKTWPAEVAAEQKAVQRGWIKGRNDCWKADDVRGCVEYSYQTRIAEVQIASGQLMAPTPVGYTCKGAEGTPVFAAFYKETDPPSAVITVGDDQVTAFISPSGSGAKYTAPNVEFWEHHGEATIDWFGSELTCKVTG
jgi:uncharacterized protein